MQDESPASGTLVQGAIKWFDPNRGFGFVADDAGGADILLHANVLRNFGQSSVADGARVRAMAARTSRGRQVVEVLAIAPPPGEGRALLPDLGAIDEATLATLPVRPARVKWFDKAKGFGFANIFGERGDVFLHVEVLRQGGFADLAAGEAVGLRFVAAPRGLMAAQVVAWERAVPGREDPAETVGSGFGDPPACGMEPADAMARHEEQAPDAGAEETVAADGEPAPAATSATSPAAQAPAVAEPGQNDDPCAPGRETATRTHAAQLRAVGGAAPQADSDPALRRAGTRP